MVELSGKYSLQLGFGTLGSGLKATFDPTLTLGENYQILMGSEIKAGFPQPSFDDLYGGDPISASKIQTPGIYSDKVSFPIVKELMLRGVTGPVSGYVGWFDGYRRFTQNWVGSPRDTNWGWGPDRLPNNGSKSNLGASLVLDNSVAKGEEGFGGRAGAWLTNGRSGEGFFGFISEDKEMCLIEPIGGDGDANCHALPFWQGVSANLFGDVQVVGDPVSFTLHGAYGLTALPDEESGEIVASHNPELGGLFQAGPFSVRGDLGWVISEGGAVNAQRIIPAVTLKPSSVVSVTPFLRLNHVGSPPGVEVSEEGQVVRQECEDEDIFVSDGSGDCNEEVTQIVTTENPYDVEGLSVGGGLTLDVKVNDHLNIGGTFDIAGVGDSRIEGLPLLLDGVFRLSGSF